MRFASRGGIGLMVTLLAALGLSSEATAEPFSYASSDVPLSIPTGPSSSGETLSYLFVPDFGQILDLNAYVYLTHDATHELEVFLVHLDTGTRVRLFNNYPGGVRIDITFDDEAASPASGAGPAYTGTYIPSRPLSAFDGERLFGTWVLEIEDDGFAGRGQLLAWGINGVYTTPEPGTMALLGMGLAGFAAYARRRRRQRTQQ